MIITVLKVYLIAILHNIFLVRPSYSNRLLEDHSADSVPPTRTNYFLPLLVYQEDRHPALLKSAAVQKVEACGHEKAYLLSDKIVPYYLRGNY